MTGKNCIMSFVAFLCPFSKHLNAFNQALFINENVKLQLFLFEGLI